MEYDPECESFEDSSSDFDYESSDDEISCEIDEESQFCSFDKYDSDDVEFFQEDNMEWLLCDTNIDNISLFVMDTPLKHQVNKLLYCRVYVVHKNKCKKTDDVISHFYCNDINCCSTTVYVIAKM